MTALVMASVCQRLTSTASVPRSPLTHSNSPFALAAVVGDGAGTNQVFFNVADLLALGGQSNFTANGSQEFAVDFRGAGDSHTRQPFTLVFDGAFSIAEAAYNSFGIEFSALTLGSTITRAGSTGAVALTFNSSVPVREITAQLQVPTTRLRGLVLSNPPASVATATVVSNSPTTALFHIVMQPGQTLQGRYLSVSFGLLRFQISSLRSFRSVSPAPCWPKRTAVPSPMCSCSRAG